MTIKNTIAVRDLEALRAAIAGQVFVAGQAGYDQARQAWNLAVDQRPSVVVEAESAADVAQAVRYARATLHGRHHLGALTTHPLATGIVAVDGGSTIRSDESAQFVEYYKYQARGEPKFVLRPRDGEWFENLLGEAEAL